MKRIISGLFLTIICFLLQSTLFARYSVGGIVPNLIIIVTACQGFMFGDKQGAVIGFLCGLLADIFFGDIIGIYAFIYMIIGFLNGKFNNIFYPEDIKLPLGLIISSDFLYGIICYVFFFLLRGRFHIGYYFAHIILPEMIYTILVTLVLYPIVLNLSKSILNDEKRSEKKFV